MNNIPEITEAEQAVLISYLRPMISNFRNEIIEKASRAYWDSPRRDGSKATIPWDDKYMDEKWKARVRDQIESALIAIGVIE